MPLARRRSLACGCSMATASYVESRMAGASTSSPRLQAEQHLEGGTAYRQVRPTRLDNTENLRVRLRWLCSGTCPSTNSYRRATGPRSAAVRLGGHGVLTEPGGSVSNKRPCCASCSPRQRDRRTDAARAPRVAGYCDAEPPGGPKQPLYHLLERSSCAWSGRSYLSPASS